MDPEGGIVWMKRVLSRWIKGAVLALLVLLVPLAGLAAVDGDLDIQVVWGDGETATVHVEKSGKVTF